MQKSQALVTMHKVQYIDVINNVRLTASMPTPKKMSNLDAWFREARKVIPEIPDIRLELWFIVSSEACKHYIRYELKDRRGVNVYVVILRTITQE